MQKDTLFTFHDKYISGKKKKEHVEITDINICKRGQYCFVKQINCLTYFCSIEIKSEKKKGKSKQKINVVSCFQIHEKKYMKDSVLIWQGIKK